jgi:tripartite ATP-independent transporter DctM subunit
MSEVTVGILGILALFILFFTGLEMAFAMAIVGLLGFCVLGSVEGAMSMVAKDLFETFSSYGLIVIPLFVFMGQVAFNAGIAKRMYDGAHRFVGHIPGGLALATVVGVTVFKTICGSAAATNATFAAVAVPEMNRFNYSPRLSTGIVAVAGTLGVLLPPSVILIIFGMITEISVGKLFLAGIFPGLALAALFAAVVIGWCKRSPEVGPKSTRFSWKERISYLPQVAWALLIFVLMIGGLMVGIFTPTEAGSVGALSVIILTFCQREMDFATLLKSIIESLRTGSMVLMLIAASTILGHFLAITNIPMITADWVVSLPIHRHVVMILIFFIFLIGGSIIDDLAFLILATPIFYPAMMKLGYDPLWVGIMISLTVVVGGVLPPVAMNVFVVQNVTKVPVGVIYRGVYPFLISMVLLIALMFVFPQIALFLPHALMK